MVLRSSAAAAAQAAPAETTITPTTTTQTAEPALPPPTLPRPATPPGYPGTVDDIIIRINEMQSQIDAVKSRCHCDHVDYHDIQIQGLLAKTSPPPPANEHHDERHPNASRGARVASPIDRCGPCHGAWDPWQQNQARSSFGCGGAGRSGGGLGLSEAYAGCGAHGDVRSTTRALQACRPAHDPDGGSREPP